MEGALIDRNEIVEAAARTMEPLPVSARRLAMVIARPDFDIEEVEEVVALDEALTFRLLRLANSAASASRVSIGTVRDAVVRVGSGTVLSVATGKAVSNQLQRPLPIYGQLWTHSVGSALAAELVVRRSKVKLPPESFTAALLHDIGKLVLARFLGAERSKAAQARQAMESRLDQGLSHGDAESEVFGIDHCELGGLIARQWSLPDRLTDGIASHKAPAEADDVVCHVVRVSSAVAKSAEQTERAGPDGATGESLSRLGLAATHFETLTTDVADRLEDVLARYA